MTPNLWKWTREGGEPRIHSEALPHNHLHLHHHPSHPPPPYVVTFVFIHGQFQAISVTLLSMELGRDRQRFFTHRLDGRKQP